MSEDKILTRLGSLIPSRFPKPRLIRCPFLGLGSTEQVLAEDQDHGPLDPLRRVLQEALPLGAAGRPRRYPSPGTHLPVNASACYISVICSMNVLAVPTDIYIYIYIYISI